MDLRNYVYTLLLTGHESSAELVTGLEAGADDYVRKSATELLARINSGQRIIRLERILRDAQSRIEVLSVTDPLTADSTFKRPTLHLLLP